MERKKDIRKEFLQKRKDLSEELRSKYSGKICRYISRHPFFQAAEIICCYIPFHEEVDTTELIRIAWKQGKKVVVPRVRDGQHMDFYELNDFSELSSGYQGILEPDEKSAHRVEVPDQEHVLMLLPGAVFDELGNRIGYGKGYYDTYLKNYRLIKKIGVAFYLQCSESIPVEQHDVCVDVVITEYGDYKRG